MNNHFRSDNPKRSTHLILGLLAACLLLLIGFGGGAAAMWLLTPDLGGLGAEIQAAPAPTLAPSSVQSDPEFALLEQIWEILQAEYIQPEGLDAQEMLHGAAAGFVSALGDPHTSFVEPMRAAIIQEDMQGAFEGIGATVEMREGVLTVVQPLPNSPAARAGIEAGDQVLEADGRALENMDIVEAISLIRGPRGTVVRLLIRREGIEEPFLVSVTRERIEMQITEARMLEGNVAYLSLSEFNALSAQHVRADLRALLRQRPVGLVLDLRNNPGGYLNKAVEIASEFLSQGTLVVTEVRREQGDVALRVTASGSALDIPLVVLVNGASASASEIVAGALQDHDRAILVGEATFGKGSVQQTHTLSDGSSLRVTIAKWVLPGGRILEGAGLDPDLVVSTTPDEVAAGRDVQLERAVEYLLQNQP